MNWSMTAAIFLALAVGLGAFGAHGLRARLDAYSMGIWEKAVFYHFIHALGLLIVSILPKTGTFPVSGVAWVGGLLLAGIVLFSGSLYALAVTGVRALGAVTPLGGISFIAAWLLLAWRLRRP
jgi:LPXTG-motif cell wall-anchored protein